MDFKDTQHQNMQVVSNELLAPDNAILEQLSDLFKKWCGCNVDKAEKLPQSGSHRKYYRLYGGNRTVIGTYNNDVRENKAFLIFSAQFKKNGLPVPEIYAENIRKNIYLQEDLGDTTLYDFLTKERTGSVLVPVSVKKMYEKVMRILPRFQVQAAEELDFSVAYPRAAFDKQSMFWDLNYFKYHFLKFTDIPFFEQDLENDFHTLTNYLLQTDCRYFLYRDFQSRNIMIHKNQPYFIDYQGGRKGALQYDVASLLYDAKAAISEKIREELISIYLEALEEYIPGIDETQFKPYFQGYALIRIMQAMGAYGYRGLFEKKQHFIQSIPPALDNLLLLLDDWQIPAEIPHLKTVLEQIAHSESLRSKAKQVLTVTIYSFSYKKGLPTDTSGNGGGFIFDCRHVHNPGRYAEYQQFTGKDQKVIQFLEKEAEMQDFLQNVTAIISASVSKYLERSFTHLMVSFGCTGGQHRSVYAAERLKTFLETQFAGQLKIRITHREIG